jgi:hypothetical protein
MLLSYLVVFWRIVIGLVFAVSSIGKARNIPHFTEAITSFRIIPKSLSRSAAPVFLSCEFAVIILMVVGGPLLKTGFLLAAMLLLIFCGALLSALARKIDTSCHCFGASEKPVSAADIWRNVGLIFCALGGYEVLAWTKENQATLGIIAWIFIGLAASVFVLIWIQLGEILQLFHNS